MKVYWFKVLAAIHFLVFLTKSQLLLNNSSQLNQSETVLMVRQLLQDLLVKISVDNAESQQEGHFDSFKG